MQRDASNYLDPYTAGSDQAAAQRPQPEVKVPAAVVWHDGMPLSPQHFQESFRRTERLFDLHLGLASPYHYGVLRLDIDGARLGSGVLHVDVEAVMPDRLQARYAGSEERLLKLDPAELRKLASSGPRRARANEFDVFLMVPWEQDGRAASGNLPRYRTTPGDAVTDDTTGEGMLEISRLMPYVQLVVDVKPPTNSTWIRIAKVRLDGDGFVRAEHVPPLFAVSREPHARSLYDVCSRLVERVRNTARRLSERRAALSKSVDSGASGGGIAADDRELLVETKRQIQSLVSALPPFEALLHTEQAHPFPLYIALAGLVGSVAGLARSLVPPVLSTYRHDDLLATFEEAATHVETMMREGIVESFSPHPLVAINRGYQVDFPRAWVGRQLVLAVRGLRGAEEGDVTGWIRNAIIASQSRATQVQDSRFLGVERDRIDRLDDLFPAGGEVLFKLKDGGNFLVADQALTVFNPKDTASNLGAFEIVLYVKEPPTETQGTSLRSSGG